MSENRIEHPTEYETRTVIDKEAYIETVVIVLITKLIVNTVSKLNCTHN